MRDDVHVNDGFGTFEFEFIITMTENEEITIK